MANSSISPCPAGSHPGVLRVHSLDAGISSDAKCAKLLVDAENWSSYFPAEDQVTILTDEPELALGTKYSRVA